MSYASLSENNSERVNERLWNPNRPVSRVKGGLATGRGVSNAQCQSLATLPRDLTGPLNELVHRPIEDRQLRDKLVSLSLDEVTARETSHRDERLMAKIRELGRELRKADRRARERDQRHREDQIQLADLQRDNKRLEDQNKGAQERISGLEATLTQRESEIRKLQQEIGALYLKRAMRDVRPLRHSA